jgi:signal transduction histidine kinase
MTLTDRLSPEREAEIAERAEAATPGPWSSHVDWPGRVFSDGNPNYLHIARTTGWNAEANERFIAHAREDVPALLAELAAVRAERDQARERITQLEKAATEGRAALASFCHDHEDPGTAALGALYLLTQATLWTEEGPDFAAEALAQYGAKVLHEVADIADPEPPEVSFFGDHGHEVAAWLRKRADYKTRSARTAPEESVR